MSERYLALHTKYLSDGEKLLIEGDHVQASEKFWGAVATMVKAVAEENGWRHHSHADLGRAVRNMAIARNDEELGVLYKRAEQLHANFYENFLDLAAVSQSSREVARLISQLQLFRSETRGDA